VVIPVTIQTSHVLGLRAPAYECYGVIQREAKTVYFFGMYERSYDEQPLVITIPMCKIIVAQMKDPFGNTLNRLSDNLYGTNFKNNAYFQWTGTIYSTVRNYYVRRLNVTLNPDDQTTIEAPGTSFTDHCVYNMSACTTTKHGIVMWYPDTIFGGRKQCTKRIYPNQPCLLSRTSLRSIS